MTIVRITRALFCGAFAIALAACSSAGNGSAVPAAAGESPDGSRLGHAVRVEITEFDDLPQGRPAGRPHFDPQGLAVDSDGAIWVAESNSALAQNPIARVLPSGKRTAKYRYGGSSTSLLGIAAGIDGALWMADPYGGGNAAIVRMTTAGEFTKFNTTGQPYFITNGPDGALWYLQAACCHLFGFIGRITTQGSITDYNQGMPWDTNINAITAGPDGALWFTETPFKSDGRTGVARITTDGTITQFPQSFSQTSRPQSIATGPDGALWFTDFQTGVGARIGRITTHGVVTEYSTGISANESPVAIAAGPDGAMWFTECAFSCAPKAGGAKIGRITMSGKITEYSNLDQGAQPGAIIQGPDHNMWFLERGTNKLARLRISS